MWNSVSSGLRRTISIRLMIAVVGILLVMFLTSAETLLNLFSITVQVSFGYHVEFVKKALCSEATLAFLPILSVLPFSASYVEDLKSKFVMFYLIRGRYNTYISSQIIVCFLVGCGVVLCGVTLFYGISLLIFVPFEHPLETKVLDTESLLPLCLLASISGGFWALLGLFFSTFMESKYIAYTSSFVTYYLLVIFCERYFPDAYMLYPPTWINPRVWPYGSCGAAIFLLELTIYTGILFAIRAGRRLRGL